MPYLSLPIEAIPDTAIVLAESPSVNMRVHSNDLPVPASLASSNLGIPAEKQIVGKFLLIKHLHRKRIQDNLTLKFSLF